jgi:hypothetical protein
MTRAQPYDLFISYHSSDARWAARLKASLQRHNITVWLDQDEIRPGDLFADALERGIAQSRALAFVVSPEAMRSGWVREEYYRALSLSAGGAMRLIPLLLRDAPLEGFIGSRQHVDFRDETTFDVRVEELAAGIRGEPKPQRPRTKPPSPPKQTFPKSRSVLDRRLATEVLVSFRGDDEPSTSHATHPALPRLLQAAHALYDEVLVEDLYGSTLLQWLNRHHELLPSLGLVGPSSRGDDDEFRLAIEESAQAWKQDAELQMRVNRYEREKGVGGLGSVDQSIRYVNDTLRLALHLDVAVIVHPDRWPLYEYVFGRSVWDGSDPFAAVEVLDVPDYPGPYPYTVADGRLHRAAALAERVTATPPASMRIVRFGPMPFPFAKALLRSYELDDLRSFETYGYEFLVASARNG